MKSSDLNCFQPQSHVSIVGIPAMQNIRVDKITDGGVHVYGSTIGHCVLSGKSPAIYYVASEIISSDGVINVSDSPIRAKRGSLIEKMNHIQVPTNLKAFTIQQLADLNEVPYPYALKWVNDNCKESGLAERKEGARGKTAKIYSLKY